MEDGAQDGAADFTFERDIDTYIPVEVTETRVTGKHAQNVLFSLSQIHGAYTQQAGQATIVTFWWLGSRLDAVTVGSSLPWTDDGDQADP